MEEYNVLRVVVSFVLVLSLIGATAAALRWWLKRNPQFAALQGAGGRLQVIESKMLDARRRLVLVKYDDRECVLLLAPDRETVVMMRDVV